MTNKRQPPTEAPSPEPKPAEKKSLIEAAPEIVETKLTVIEASDDIEDLDDDIDFDNDDAEYEHNHPVSLIPKAHFAGMMEVLHALHFAFYPFDPDEDVEYDDDEANDKIRSLHNVALAVGGWTEDEFWAKMDMTSNCPICGEGEPPEAPKPKLVKDKLTN